MADFQGLDFLLLDEELSDEEILARDTVRSFVTKEFMPVIQEHVRQDGSFPMELVPKIAELGLFGANLHGYGCAGMSNVGYGLLMQELERGDSGLRSFASVQGSLCMYPIHAYGSDAQKERWLPAMAAGEAIGCFGLTEPDFGSFAQGMRTKAERQGGTWILNGTKRWITNGSLADVAIVWAQTEEGVRGFLVEKGMPGYETPDIKGKFSLRGSVTSELYFKDVELSEESRLPKAEGMKGPLSCLTQAKLADMLTEITKGQLLALRVGRLKDAGKLHHTMVSMAKRNNVDIALRTARDARDLLGANGIVDDYQAMRHMVNLETVRTYEGTHDIHTLILGEHITGHRAL
jgi:glutaryl-CoA dehydrogenase